MDQDSRYRTKGRFFGLAPASRIATAEAFTGRRVAVTVSLFRNSELTETYVGTLLAGASTNGGTTRDVVVLRLDDGDAIALSGATVRTIEDRPAAGQGE